MVLTMGGLDGWYDAHGMHAFLILGVYNLCTGSPL